MIQHEVVCEQKVMLKDNDAMKMNIPIDSDNSKNIKCHLGNAKCNHAL